MSNDLNESWDKEVYYTDINESHLKNNLEIHPVFEKLKSSLLKHKKTNNVSFEILDVGCGEGTYIKTLSKHFVDEYKYTGVEVSKKGVEMAIAKKITRSNFLVYDGNTIPFDENTFDLAFSCFVFEHLTDPERVFSEMVRVTKVGGRIIIVCPNYGSAFFRSPCNTEGALSLMIHRLLDSIWSPSLFKNKFNWNRVTPIPLGPDEHIMDYDTNVEPSLINMKKYLLKNRHLYDILDIDSMWKHFEIGSNNIFKKTFLNFIKFLGVNNFPILKYHGPFFYIEIKKK